MSSTLTQIRIELENCAKIALEIEEIKKDNISELKNTSQILEDTINIIVELLKDD